MGMHSTSHTGVPAKAFPETKTCIPYSLEILGARSPKKPIHKSGPRGPWAGGPQTQPLLRINGTVLVEAGLGKLKQADSPGGKKRQGGSHGLECHGPRPCLDHPPWRMPPLLPLVLGGHGGPHWGVIQLPSPPTCEAWGPSLHPPEVVAWGYVVVHVPGVQAAEGIPGQAEGGGPVQVAVPLDLDAHDASLWGASRAHSRR